MDLSERIKFEPVVAAGFASCHCAPNEDEAREVVRMLVRRRSGHHLER